MRQNFARLIQLPDLTQRSTFLWGPRKCGKSYFLRHAYPDTPLIDLLKTEEFIDYTSSPALLRERYDAGAWGVRPSLLIIDEIQKVPALLDEVHWLIENRDLKFILTGSSARKVRRGQANLLGGRALRREIHPLTLYELQKANYPLDLEHIVSAGLIPLHLTAPDPRDDLRAYVGDYLKEEIASEGALQNLPAFSRFLTVAGITNAEILNYTNIAREVEVSAKAVRQYFDLLEDTLIGLRLPAWTKKTSRRATHTNKFFLFDCGVANFLARRSPKRQTPEFGKSLEHLVFLELIAYRSYRDPELDLAYWRTDRGVEVDFILGDRLIALEVKSATRVHETDCKGLNLFTEDGAVRKRMIVCLERAPRVIRDRYGEILILPLEEFVSRLWDGQLVG